MNGSDRDFYNYNPFTGSLISHLHEHTRFAAPVLSELYTYTYDSSERLTGISHKLNDKPAVLLSGNEYNELGQLCTQSLHNGLFHTAYGYNVRGWLSQIENPLFHQNLHYTDGAGVPCYDGNISSMTWQTGNVLTETKENAPKGMSAEKGYKFHYDGLSRLTDAVYGEGVSLSDNPNRFNEQITGYDKMGNILGLKRYGQTTASTYGLIDDLSLSYDGNQLQTVNDNSLNSVYADGFEFKDGAKEDIEYAYDSNGNLLKDLNKKITDIQYNYLNLPRRIEFENGNCISYLYDANGTKLRTTHVIGKDTTVTDYCGNAVYENGVPLTLLTQYGYVSLNDNKYHYYIQDHQGNNRVVVDQDGNVEEVNEYYPFGGLMASSVGSVQPYKYNGKELNRKSGLNWYDYGARMYDPLLGRFAGPDPLAEAWAHVNPYNYCFNNPVNRTDPTGMASVYNWNTKRYEDENGNEVSWESVQQEYGIDDKDNGNTSGQQESDRLSPVPPEVNTMLTPWGTAASLHAGLKYTEHPFGGGYFRTKKGVYYSMDIFKQPTNTKSGRKAKGMVNSAQVAKNTTKLIRGVGNAVGGLTTAISVYNCIVDTNVRNAIDVTAGIASYYYWEIGLLYLYGSVSYDTTIMNSQQMQENLQNGVNPMRGTFNFQTGRYEF